MPSNILYDLQNDIMLYCRDFMKYIFVANWKMNVLTHQVVDFYNNNKNVLETLAFQNTIILCPSFISIPPLANAIKNSSIHIGAQDCSAHLNGAYTGEVSAQSLAQAGVTYCIVGHSERRTYWNETDEMIAKKTEQLLSAQIIPIICIGETLQEHEQQKTKSILTKQLELIVKLAQKFSVKELIIAYEPIWAIGTGVTPSIDYLENIFNWLYTHITTQISRNTELQLLYGGSVTAASAIIFKTIKHINGFLIGGASTTVESFKSIIADK